MNDYQETIRPGLARAMGWEIRWLTWGSHSGKTGIVPGSMEGRHPAPITGTDWTPDFPDPLNRADNAEALWTWCEEQGWEVDRSTYTYISTGLRVAVCEVGSPSRVLGRAEVDSTQEPDPIRRRRRALVEAVWTAVQGQADA